MDSSKTIESSSTNNQYTEIHSNEVYVQQSKGNKQTPGMYIAGYISFIILFIGLVIGFFLLIYYKLYEQFIPLIKTYLFIILRYSWIGIVIYIFAFPHKIFPIYKSLIQKIAKTITYIYDPLKNSDVKKRCRTTFKPYKKLKKAYIVLQRIYFTIQLIFYIIAFIIILFLTLLICYLLGHMIGWMDYFPILK